MALIVIEQFWLKNLKKFLFSSEKEVRQSKIIPEIEENRFYRSQNC